MNSFKKSLNYQQKVNEAVSKLMEHFSQEVDMSSYYEEFAIAEAEIMSMIRLTDGYINSEKFHGDVYNPNTVVDFLVSVNTLYKMLKPFDKLANEQDER